MNQRTDRLSQEGGEQAEHRCSNEQNPSPQQHDRFSGDVCERRDKEQPTDDYPAHGGQSPIRSPRLTGNDAPSTAADTGDESFEGYVLSVWWLLSLRRENASWERFPCEREYHVPPPATATNRAPVNA